MNIRLSIRLLTGLTLALLLVAVWTATAPASLAQDQPAGSGVTDDQVNAIASKLYCPVCENIPLDACGTAACADWRYEIKLQLQAGMTEDQIVEDFVRRFGDRVVGTPLDPLLRALSLATPWLAIGGGLLVGGWWLLRYRRGSNQPEHPTALTGNGTTTPGGAGSYYEMLENDLNGRSS